MFPFCLVSGAYATGTYRNARRFTTGRRGMQAGVVNWRSCRMRTTLRCSR
jgi:hypothetical protein